MNNSQRENQWKQWIEDNKHLMKHVANFEVRFVQDILTGIPEIDPSYVTAQFPFKDQKNGNRRIDFMILNEQKGIRLAIEIDGLWKMQQDQVDNHIAWNDLLSRQNALLRALGCMLLRYSNQTWLNKPKFVIQEIRSELLKQEYDHSSAVEAKLRIANDKNCLEGEITQKNLKIAELQKDQQKMAQLQTEYKRLLASSAQIQKNLSSQEQETGHYKSFRDDSIKDYEEAKREIGSLAEKNPNMEINQPEQLQKADSQAAQAAKDQISSVAAGASLGMSSAEAERTFSQKELTQITKQLLAILDDSNKSKLSESRKTPLIIFVSVLITSVTIGFFMHSNSQPELAISTRYVTPPASSINTSLGESNVSVNDYLSTTEANRHVGEKTTLCGRIVQIREADKVTYLNFDKAYPNSTVTAVIWNENAKNFSGVNQKVNRTVCIEGEISNYKGKPQIILRDSAQLITK
jgi:very-short-patch-repair endonuclease